jgi:hypothetical protein
MSLLITKLFRKVEKDLKTRFKTWILNRNDKACLRMWPQLHAFFTYCLGIVKKKILLTYKEIQKGAVMKSYMRKVFLINEEMRKYLVIYEEAVSHKCSLLNFLIYEENFSYFFFSV